MAREILGQMACPECGGAAEVKQQKNGLAYRWCMDCHAQYFPRTAEASDRLLAKCGAAKPAPVTAPAPVPATAPKPKPKATQTPTQTPPKPQTPEPQAKPKAASPFDILGQFTKRAAP